MQKNKRTSVWALSPEILDLQSDRVDVWRIRLNLPIGMLDQLDASLSDEERERAATFHFAADRDRYIASHGCLRDVLTRYLQCEPHQLSFSKDSYGKPVLRDEALQFNLSHSADFALIAIAQERKVGVDVERVRSGISSHVIAQQYFSKSEFAELQSLSLEQRETAFFTCWTRKEAYIKAQGLGFSMPLEDFDVSLTPHEPAMLRATRPDLEEATRWTLLDLGVDPGYQAAVAAEGQGIEFRLWAWNALAMPGMGDTASMKRIAV